MNLMAVRVQRRGRVGPRAGVAVLQAVAPGPVGLLNGKPLQKQRVRLRHAVGQRDHHQRSVPEVFVLVVLHQPGANAAGLTDIHARQAGFRQLAHQEIHAYLQRLGGLDELAQLAARHFNDANNARRDFGDTHAARVTGGEVYLDGLEQDMLEFLANAKR